MAAEELQQLRDIHLPDPPGMWPPAPGWWLLGLLALAAVGWLLWLGLRRYRRGRPLRYGRRLYADVYARYQRGELDTREYLDATNELIKRLLIHGLGEDAARRATGQRWLELLDAHLEEPAFTAGPGRALGNVRFQPHPDGQPERVHAVVQRLLDRLTAATPPQGAR